MDYLETFILFAPTATSLAQDIMRTVRYIADIQTPCSRETYMYLELYSVESQSKGQ